MRHILNRLNLHSSGSLAFLATMAIALLTASSPSALALGLEEQQLLEVLDVLATPNAVNPGEPVAVRSTVRNPLDHESEFSIALLLDDSLEEERTVRLLPAGATRVLKFSVSSSEPGGHLVRQGAETAAFQVLPAQFELRELSISPTVVAANEPVSLLATLENAGPGPGTFQVPLAVGGSVTETRSGFLEAGETAPLFFQVGESTSGSHTVLLGALPGSFTVVAPSIDMAVPQALPISLEATVARTEAGDPLSLTGDQVSLWTGASGKMEVLLPVGLEPGGALGSFRDPISGVEYDGDTLVLPLRDAQFKEMARLVIVPAGIDGQGTAARVTSASLSLVVPSMNIGFSSAPSPAGPVSFGMELPVTGLTPGTPLLLTQGHHPPQKMLARVEVEAGARNMSVAEVVGSVSIDTGATASGGGTVTFGVSRAWFESLQSDTTVAVVHVGQEGVPQILDIGEISSAGEQTLLSAPAAQGRGRFLLVTLTPQRPAKVIDVMLSQPVAVVGEPVRVRAVVDGSGDGRVASPVVLRLNDQPVDVAPVRRLDGGAEEATFYVTVKESGLYTLEVDGVTAQLPAGLADTAGHIQVAQLDISSDAVTPGQPVSISAVVLNAGPQEVVSEAVLQINGVQEGSKLLRMTSGAVEEVQFQVARQRVGTYDIALLNARGRFVVGVEPTPPSLEASGLEVVPHLVGPGEPVEVSFVVKNMGEQTGIYEASLTINGEESQRVELVMDGLTTVPVTLATEATGSGIHTVEVAGLRGEYIVVPVEERTGIVLVDLQIQPQTIPSGESAMVTVGLRNRYRNPERGFLVFTVGDEVIERREVSLAAEESGQQLFLFRQDRPGTYRVSVQQELAPDLLVGTLSRQYLVTRALTPASFEILSLDISPSPAKPMEAMAVTLLLVNLGEREGTFDLQVSVDEAQEIAEEVQLPGQSSRQLTLSLEGRPPGSYVVEVNGRRLSFAVGGEEQASEIREEPPQERVASPTVSLERTAAIAGALLLIVGTLLGTVRWERATRWKR